MKQTLNEARKLPTLIQNPWFLNFSLAPMNVKKGIKDGSMLSPIWYLATCKIVSFAETKIEYRGNLEASRRVT